MNAPSAAALLLTLAACAAPRAATRALEAPMVEIGEGVMCLRGDHDAPCADDQEAAALVQDHVAANGIVVSGARSAGATIHLSADARALRVRVRGTARYQVEYLDASGAVIDRARGVLYGGQQAGIDLALELAPDMRTDAITVRLDADLGERAHLRGLAFATSPRGDGALGLASRPSGRLAARR